MTEAIKRNNNIKIAREYDDDDKNYKELTKDFFEKTVRQTDKNIPKDCNYLKTQFEILDDGLAYEQNFGLDFFINLSENDYSPREGELIYESLKDKVELIKEEEARLRKILQDLLSKNAVNVKKNTEKKYNVGKINNKYDQLLEDKINSYNHYTSYGVMIFIGIIVMGVISTSTTKQNAIKS